MEYKTVIGSIEMIVLKRNRDDLLSEKKKLRAELDELKSGFEETNHEVHVVALELMSVVMGMMQRGGPCHEAQMISAAAQRLVQISQRNAKARKLHS